VFIDLKNSASDIFKISLNLAQRYPTHYRISTSVPDPTVARDVIEKENFPLGCRDACSFIPSRTWIRAVRRMTCHCCHSMHPEFADTVGDESDDTNRWDNNLLQLNDCFIHPVSI
jgi:hypothetical protein